MSSICGSKCNECPFAGDCAGCEKTCGRPFGGKCVAAEYIKANGKAAYDAFKASLLSEINVLLSSCGIPEANELFELPGSYVNLKYPLSNGGSVKLLCDDRVYLGCQIESDDGRFCFGVAADTELTVISSYRENGVEPQLILYKRR